MGAPADCSRCCYFGRIRDRHSVYPRGRPWRAAAYPTRRSSPTREQCLAAKRYDAAVAIFHNNAGQHAKGEARRLLHRIIWTLTVLAMLTGIGVGLMITHLGSWVGLLVAAAVAACLMACSRFSDRYTDRLAKERVKWLRGGQSEGFVAWLLKDLDDRWHVFNGLQLEPDSDVDHIVVGPGGVYSISTKGYRGLFEADEQGNLLYNRQPTKLLQATFMQAMKLRDRLTALLGEDVPFVNAVLAVPHGYVAFSGPRRNVWVLNETDLTDVMERAPQRLDGRQVRRLVECVSMLDRSAAAVYLRPAPPAPAAPPVSTAPTEGN